MHKRSLPMFDNVLVVVVVTNKYEVMVDEAMKNRFSRDVPESGTMPDSAKSSSTLDDASSVGIKIASSPRSRLSSKEAADASNLLKNDAMLLSKFQMVL